MNCGARQCVPLLRRRDQDIAVRQPEDRRGEAWSQRGNAEQGLPRAEGNFAFAKLSPASAGDGSGQIKDLDFAASEHYNTAVIPCRVRSPKDKAMVEGTVGVISTFILAALRNRQFLSLSELNEAIFEKLEEFNHKPFQKKDGSRALLFEEEKPFLQPLPPRPFELATWKVATVGPNYHISVEKMNYSVPYEYIRQKVDVRVTRNTVEVFFGGNRICSHVRLYGRANQYSTTEAHMPPNHRQYSQWNGDRFRRWAGKIGPNTGMVVSAILSGYKVEQQGYKSCLGLLKLADKYSPQRLEGACTRALTFTPRPSLKNIQAILASGQDRLPVEESAKADTSAQYGFTRGADYYGGRDK